MKEMQMGSWNFSSDEVRDELSSAYNSLRRLIIRKLMIVIPANQLNLEPDTITGLMSDNAGKVFTTAPITDTLQLPAIDQSAKRLLEKSFWSAVEIEEAKTCTEEIRAFIGKYSGNCEFFSWTNPSQLFYSS